MRIRRASTPAMPDASRNIRDQVELTEWDVLYLPGSMARALFELHRDIVDVLDELRWIPIAGKRIGRQNDAIRIGWIREHREFMDSELVRLLEGQS